MLNMWRYKVQGGNDVGGYGDVQGGDGDVDVLGRDIQQNIVIKCLETCKKNVVFSGGGRREQTYIIRNMIGEAKEAQAANVSVLKM